MVLAASFTQTWCESDTHVDIAGSKGTHKIIEKPILASEPLFRIGNGISPQDIPPFVSYFIKFPPSAARKHLLCLDLDETLVSSKRRTKQTIETEDFSILIYHEGHPISYSIRKRPYLSEFLNTMSGLFELCIFTYSIRAYADQIIDLIDPNGLVKYRLYRENCVQFYGESNSFVIVKDLSRVGKPLSNVLLLDNTKPTGLWQRNNFLFVESFFGESNDSVLATIIPLLEHLASCEDIYKEIYSFRHARI